MSCPRRSSSPLRRCGRISRPAILIERSGMGFKRRPFQISQARRNVRIPSPSTVARWSRDVLGRKSREETRSKGQAPSCDRVRRCVAIHDWRLGPLESCRPMQPAQDRSHRNVAHPSCRCSPGVPTGTLALPSSSAIRCSRAGPCVSVFPPSITLTGAWMCTLPTIRNAHATLSLGARWGVGKCALMDDSLRSRSERE